MDAGSVHTMLTALGSFAVGGLAWLAVTRG